MPLTNISQRLLDQSNDLFWVVNLDFQLVYANQRYLSIIKKITGKEHKLFDSAFTEYFGADYIDKWKTFYTKAFKGESFDVEDHHLNPESNEIEYGLTTLEPLRDEDNKVSAVACQSKNITHIVKQRSEANQMMDASLDVFCTVNEQGKFVYVNAASYAHWGYLPEELIGKPFYDLLLEEDAKKTENIINALKNGQKIKSFVNRYKKKNGDIAYNLWSATWDESTKLRYAVAKDFKEKIEEEEIVQLSEKRFRALVQEGSDLIAILDNEGNCTYVSPTSTTILGIAPEEFIGRNAFEFIHPDDAEKILAGWRKLNTEHKVSLEPFQFQNNKKEWRWIETVLTNMLNNPAVNGIVANSRDITEWVIARKQIEANEQFNRSVLESSPDCLKVLDVEGRIKYMNSNGLCQMEIDDFSSVSNKEWWTLWGSENKAFVKTAIDKAVRGETAEFTALRHTTNGTPKWWEVAVSPVSKHGESVNQIITVSRDITERKIEEQEKELLAEISFNFNAENDLLDTSSKICNKIAEFGRFDWVEIGAINLEKNKILVLGHYFIDIKDEIFYTDNPEFSALKTSEGMAGKVWTDQVPILWDVNEENKGFVRLEAAKKMGLKHIIGIPLVTNNEIVGVLQIGTKQKNNNLKNYKSLFKKLNQFLGSELKRKKLEYELSQLFDAIPDIVGVGDFQGRILKINKAGCELLGYSEEELLYHSFNDFVHPLDKDVAAEELKNLRSGKPTLQFEVRIITKDGSIIWLGWQINPSIKEAVIYFTAKNITEEYKLKELNQQTRQLAKIGSWDLDLVNQTLYWSEEVHQLHETDPNSFVPDFTTAINFYREDFRQLVNQSVEKSATTGEPFDFEAVIVTANRNEIWVRSIGNAELLDGKCTRIYGSFQDINFIKETENRLRSISNNLPAVVYQYLILPDGTDLVRNVSDGATQVWGFTAAQAAEDINLVWNQLIAGGDFEQAKASIQESIKTKSKWSFRNKYVMPSGELRTHLSSGLPVFLSDGTVLFNTITLDITQEAKNEELLEQITKLTKTGSWEMDLRTMTPYFSEETFRIYDLPLGLPPKFEDGINFYSPEAQPIIREAVAQAIENQTPYDIELPFVTAKGKNIWVRTYGIAEVINGKAVRIFGAIQDITERKEAEIDIIDSEEKRRLIMNGALDAIISIDTNEIITFWNPKAEIIFGWKEEEVLGKQLSELIIPPAFRRYHVEGLKNYLKTGEGKAINVLLELSALRRNGEEFPIELTVIPIKQAGDEFFCAFIRDITQRKEAEREKNNLQSTLENSLNEIYIFDAETLLFSYVNKGALNNLGYSNHEINALTPLDIKPDFTATSFQELITPLVNNEKEKIVFFTSHKRKDGSLYPVEVHLQLVSVGNNKRFVAIILDITERKNAEKEIKFKANLLSTIEQAAIATDLNGVVNYWNKAAESIYGWSLEEAIGQNIVHLTTSETGKEQAMQIMEKLKKGETWSGNFKMQKKDGHEFIALVSYSPVYDEKNILSGIIGVSTDITQQIENEKLLKQYTQELENSNERFEKVTDATNDVIWDWDIINQTYYRSQAIERFFGKGALKLLFGEDLWTERFHLEDLEMIQNSVRAALANPLQDRWEQEYRIIHENGNTIYVIDRGVIIRDEEGKAIRMVGAMTDISEQKKLAVQLIELNQDLQKYTIELERSNEELEQFAFVASHDLQEPLRMITSFLNQLNRKYEGQLDPKAQQYIHFATDGAKRMKQIILDLLQFSRTGKPTDGKEKVDFNEVIAEFIQLRKKIISEKKATITFQGLPTIITYKAAITQIIHCLLDNAIKYTDLHTKPIVHFNSIEKINEWEFSINDNGIGIDTQFYDKVFIIFQRLHNKEEYGGTGIGLSIAKRHVEFLGGRIWLESKPGEGTIFYFTIPKTIEYE